MASALNLASSAGSAFCVEAFIGQPRAAIRIGPGLGSRGHIGPVEPRQFPAGKQLAPRDPNIAHDVTGAAENQLCDRIADGLRARAR